MEIKEQVMLAGSGRWVEILSAFGFDSQSLDGKGHPCPKCLDGKDRFSFRNYNGDGAVYCRVCNSEGVDAKDGIGAVMWLTESSFVDAVTKIAEYLSISVSTDIAQRVEESMLVQVARMKRVTPESLLSYGCKDAFRSDKLSEEDADARNYPVIRFPVYGLKEVEVEGERQIIIDVVSSFDMGVGTPRLRKGKCAYRSDPGLFLPHRKKANGEWYRWYPSKGKPVYLVEGVKDAAKLLELGYTAIGLPGTRIPKELWRLFQGLTVYLVPDRDTAGENGAVRNARLLWGIAEEVRIVRLPVEMKSKDGDGVREVANRLGGEVLLRDAISSARVWKPTDETIVNSVVNLREAGRYYYDQRKGRSLRVWSTGIKDLDFSIGGISDSDVFVVGGRPGRGKTAKMVHLATSHVASGGVPLIFSAEMRTDDIAERFLQRALHQTRGQLRDAVHGDPEALLEKIDSLSEFDGLLFAPRTKDVNEIIRVIEDSVIAFGVTMVFLDYIQIVKGDGRDSIDRIDDAMGKLVDVGKRLGVSIGILSQLNRTGEEHMQGDDIKPQMSWLKGSGSIEQDPDIIMYVNWPGVVEGEEADMDIYVLKNRNGPIRTKKVSCRFDPRYYVFEDKQKFVSNDFFER